MNTVDTPEDSSVEATVPAQNMVLVPLSRLRSRRSKRNVRQQGWHVDCNIGCKHSASGPPAEPHRDSLWG